MISELQWLYWSGFRIIVQCYFIITAALILRHIYKHRKNSTEISKNRYQKQEIIIGLSFIGIAIILPYLYNANIQDQYVRAQAYFHLWDSLSVQYICWGFYLWGSKVQNRKHNRHVTYMDWKKKVQQKNNSENPVKTDFQRKLLHLFPPFTLISLYYIGLLLESKIPTMQWDRYSITTFFSSSISFGFMYVMFIFDYIRLNRFKLLGKFAHDWAEHSIRPKELDTFNSAIAMTLGFVPFYAAPIQVMLPTVLIVSIADALASIIGKKFGSHRYEKSGKSLEGFITGFISTYFLVILSNQLLSLTEIALSPLKIHLMAFAAAFGFLLVDIFAHDISDNFLNPIFSGGIMWIVYIILSSL